MTPAQLHLFDRRVGRTPGRNGTLASEFRTQCAVADTIRRWLKPGWRWTHLPFGELRTPATGARLKRMGVTRGWPDFIFVHERGRVCWLELKRRGGNVTAEQEDIFGFLRGAGHEVRVAYSFEQAIEALKLWGVLPAGVNPQ